MTNLKVNNVRIIAAKSEHRELINDSTEAVYSVDLNDERCYLSSVGGRYIRLP